MSPTCLQIYLTIRNGNFLLAWEAVGMTDIQTIKARPWLGLFAVLTALIMNILDSTIVTVAAPSIRESLGGSYASIQWLTAGYTLALATGLLTGGRLGDMFGRRRV